MSSDSLTGSSSAFSSSISRLRNIANHMAPATATKFPAEDVPQAPEDPLFGLMRAYRADESSNKVDLVGLYL
jgi:aspartate aminotransferase, cytoplasmic